MKSKKDIPGSKPLYWVILTSIFFLVVLFVDLDFNTPTAETFPGEPLKIYAEPLGIYLPDTILHSIGNAKKSISIIIYTLRDWKIIKALNQQAEAGIYVTVIYDTEASKGVEKHLSPKIRLISRTSRGLMHIKLIIIDEKHLWMGSTNLTKDALKKDANLMIHVHEKALTNYFLKKLNQFIGDAYEKPLEVERFFVENQEIELHFLPDDLKALESLLKLIQSAEKTIEVAMYAFTHQDLATELIKAKKRGIQVTVVLDKTLAKGVGKKVVQMLKENGVFVKIYEKEGIMHHKFIVVDHQKFAHGSTNWTKAAFKQNDDCFMIISNLNLSQKKALHEIWTFLLKDSNSH